MTYAISGGVYRCATCTPDQRAAFSGHVYRLVRNRMWLRYFPARCRIRSLASPSASASPPNRVTFQCELPSSLFFAWTSSACSSTCTASSSAAYSFSAGWGTLPLRRRPRHPFSETKTSHSPPGPPRPHYANRQGCSTSMRCSPCWRWCSSMSAYPRPPRALWSRSKLTWAHRYVSAA